MSTSSTNNKFWNEVMKCKHRNISPNYISSFTCETPYCYGWEDHCLDCGVYITKCMCGYNTGMSGWPRKRLINNVHGMPQ